MKKEREKAYAVIGLGRFGMSVAKTLAETGCDLLVVDDDEESILQIQDQVSDAVCADVTETGVMQSVGIQNMDVVIVGISKNMEASITATFQAKDLGVPYVVAKAINEVHGKILSRVGADEVVYPESTTGQRIARKLITGNCMDIFGITDNYSMVEIEMPKKWAGETLNDLQVRKKYNVNVLGIRIGDKLNIQLDPFMALPWDATILLVGRNEDLEKI